MSNTMERWQHDRFNVYQDTPTQNPRIQFLFIGRSFGIFTPLIPIDELPREVHLVNVKRTLDHHEAMGLEIVGNSPFSGHVFTLEHPRGHSHNEPDRSLHDGHPEITYVLNRCYGTYTPLIPADELPLEVDLAGVPRRLQQQHVRGKIVGHAPTSRGFFALERPPRQATPVLNHQGFPGPSRATARTSSTTLQQDTIRRDPITHRPLPPSGVEPDETKKIYCDHWIVNGWCRFAQKGCLYKHEVPLDRQVLKSIIGRTEYPRWWLTQEKARKEREGASMHSGAVLASERELAKSLPRRPLLIKAVPVASSSASASASETEMKKHQKGSSTLVKVRANNKPVDYERKDPYSSSSSSETESKKAAKAPSYTSTKINTETPHSHSTLHHAVETTTAEHQPDLVDAPGDTPEEDLISFAPITPTPAATATPVSGNVTTCSTPSSSAGVAAPSTSAEPNKKLIRALRRANSPSPTASPRTTPARTTPRKDKSVSSCPAARAPIGILCMDMDADVDVDPVMRARPARLTRRARLQEPRGARQEYACAKKGAAVVAAATAKMEGRVSGRR
ncbi:hypothetical protein H2203_008163 [Taxawa tesnikishii (nom. ined.)]|nr:hypothetical protein H2203_008163 [Dothideales sp. JES 119]